ncbi:hypothetical protein [Roseicyclus mahoneyensis]|uniref:hypothetical protein n=1 Tax=Roseicyclus mahoneyensis TaxID=164332 RepID=UPI0011B2150C|nr:hypothetical protein [Roseicyclus mahoneyensis]
MSYVFAALIGLATPSAAQDHALFTLDDALSIALEIGQAWPDDLTTLREIVAGDRAITWSGFVGIPGPSAPGPFDDPWLGGLTDASFNPPVSIHCIRTGRDRLAALREIQLLYAAQDNRDVARLEEVLHALAPPATWLESHAVAVAWREVPHDAIAAQFCFLGVPIADPDAITAAPPAILTGLFDSIGPFSVNVTGEQPEPGSFIAMMTAEGWRGPGPSGGIGLTWYEEIPFAVLRGENDPATVVITVASWLSPLGS